MLRWLVNLVDRHRRLVLALLLVVTASAGFAALRIRYDFRPRALFAGDDGLLDVAEEVRATFGSDNSVLLIIAEATGDKDVLDQALLTWQAEVAREVNRLVGTAEVEAVVLLRPPRPGLIRGWRVGVPVVRQLPVSDKVEQRLRNVLAETPLVTGTLLSHDQRLSVIAVTVRPGATDFEPVRRLVHEVQDVLHRRPPPPDFRVLLSGLPAIRVEIVEEMRRDQRTLIPLVAVLFVVVLVLSYGHLSTALLPLVSVGVGLVWTLGWMGLRGQDFNLISNALPLLLLVIGTSNTVHILNRYTQQARLAAGDYRAAARETMIHMAVACFLASITTSIGFLSIAAAQSDVLRIFGRQAALGMLMLYLSTMLVMGTFLSTLRPAVTSKGAGRRSLSGRVAAAACSFAVRYPWPAVLVSVSVVAVAIICARSVTINSYQIESYDEGHPTISTLRKVEQHLSGVVPLEVVLEADQHTRFLEPRNFAAINDFQEFAQQLEHVTLARSFVDIYQAAYQKVRRSDPTRLALPTLDADGKRRIEFSERLVSGLAESFDYRRFMSRDGRRARIRLQLRDFGTKQGLQLIDRLDRKLVELFPQESGISFLMTGDAYLSAKAINQFIRDIAYSLGAAAVVSFAIIGLLFRSFRIGLIAAVPNVTPMAVALGYMGLRGYQMNIANVIVFAISLGIAVDDTIHFLARFREESLKHDDVASAVRATFDGAGKAIVLTTFLIISGLSVLLLSEFVPSRRVAELVSVSMIAALVGDLILLPACLVLFWKPASDRPPQTT